MPYQRIGVFGATGQLGREERTVAGISTQRLGSLVGFDAIVSTVGHTGMDEQISLIERAKTDGVKRFVPSEFGVDHRTVKSDFFKPKMKVFEAVEKAAFPDGWTAIACGFMDHVIAQFVQVQPQQSTITIRGNGVKQYPFSVRYDIGRILAHTFKHPLEYENVWLTVANGWFSLREIAQIIKERSELDFTVQNADLNDKVPVLRLLELNDLDIFDRKGQTESLPVDLTDIKEYMR